MAAEGWKLTDEQKEKFIPIIKAYFEKVENLAADQISYEKRTELGIDFTGQGINPAQLEELVESFGYEEADIDRNGWEMDFWITMKRTDGKKFPSKCETLVIKGCGMTFELKLCIEGFVF